MSLSALTGLLLAYLAALSAANANPARISQHAADALAQGANVGAMAALIGVVAAANRRNGCGGRPTWSWIVLGVLTANLAARLVSLAIVPARANAEAKFVRWDTAAKTVGMLAVLTEVYYSLVPRARFRTALFVLGLVFVVPVVLALPRLFSGAPPDVTPALLRDALDASAAAYDAYDGKDHAGRVVTRRIGDVLFVGFAGTENATDAKIDVNIADVPVPWLPGKARVHAGFAGLYALLRDGVRDRVRREISGAARVAFVGHSLGGALATLAALDAAASGAAPRVMLVTFGGPQVGDANFVAAFDAAVPVAARVVNPFDPVPKALAAQLKHTKGYRAVASLTMDSPLTAHDLATYRLALSRPRWMQLLGVVAPAGYVLVGGAAVVAFHVLRRRA